MATEPVNAPVPLLRVLEEEYEALHGPLPPSHTALNPHNRLAALYTRIHQLPQKRTALCLCQEEEFEVPRSHWESFKRLLTSHSSPGSTTSPPFQEAVTWGVG